MITRLSTYRVVSGGLALLMLASAIAVPTASATCTKVSQGTTCPCGPACCTPDPAPEHGKHVLSNEACCSLSAPETHARTEVIPSAAASQVLAHEADMLLASCSPGIVFPETGVLRSPSGAGRHLTQDDIPVFHLSLLI